MPEAFAVVKNACRRFLGKEVTVRGHALKWDMVPFDVQLIGAWALHKGRIAEMATGEGKTDIQKKVESKQDEIKEVMAEGRDAVPKVELQLDEESKEAFKGLADFSSSTEYGIEGMKKAQQNSDEKQIALLKKIAKNTEDTTGLGGV